jgi:hypothetical protein
LEHAARTFVHGYHRALQETDPDALEVRLGDVEAELRGFAFEGAAMALALLDMVTPWKRDRVQAFLAGAGSRHIYMVHVGVGWALARLHKPIKRRIRAGQARRPNGRMARLAKFDPLLGHLIMDGYGFHEGFFDWRRYVQRQEVPDQLEGYDRRMFDQGLGRSVWFVDGADAERIPRTVAAFAPRRRADLWSGVGLACAYAGGVDRSSIEALREAAGSNLPQMGLGAAFAAKARQRAGNAAPHTELACEILCGMSAGEAAELTDATLQGLTDGGSKSAYERWRQRVEARLAVGVRAR